MTHKIDEALAALIQTTQRHIDRKAEAFDREVILYDEMFETLTKLQVIMERLADVHHRLASPMAVLELQQFHDQRKG